MPKPLTREAEEQGHLGVIAVVGGGTMGVGIAYVFAVAGYEVTVVEPSGHQRRDLVSTFDGALAGALERAKITDDAAEAARDHLTLVPSVGDLPEGADLAIETVPEQITQNFDAGVGEFVDGGASFGGVVDGFGEGPDRRGAVDRLFE